MKLTINGKPKDVQSGTTVFSLLEHLEMHADAVNVQLNGEILPRDRYESATLQEGDEVEILMHMGGGSV